MSQKQICRLGFFRISREDLRASIGAACSEVVWNEGDRLKGTGCGISDEFDEIQIGYDSIPWYQWEIKDGRATATRVSLRGSSAVASPRGGSPRHPTRRTGGGMAHGAPAGPGGLVASDPGIRRPRP